VRAQTARQRNDAVRAPVEKPDAMPLRAHRDSGLADGNSHQHDHLPTMLVGSACGGIRCGRAWGWQSRSSATARGDFGLRTARATGAASLRAAGQ